MDERESNYKDVKFKSTWVKEDKTPWELLADEMNAVGKLPDRDPYITGTPRKPSKVEDEDDAPAFPVSRKTGARRHTKPRRAADPATDRRFKHNRGKN